MDFFARQDHARAQTRQLIALFVLAVVVVDIAVTAVLVFGFGLGMASRGRDVLTADGLLAYAPVVGVIALGVLAVILGGAGVKSMQLAAGGSAVARSMGADLVEAGTPDPLKRRLLNVVEEMAIASGVPVPAVYVMEGERGINAFAAGHSPADSAVCVTRGALETFDRDELQGVIGHEFSHILNGDMKLNMTLIGLVAGLFAISQVGRVLMRARGRKSGGIVLAGLAMMVLGWVGMLMGTMIQAAISRQREFLADASAVQFARSTQGIRDALVKVGASSRGSRLGADDTHEVSHMLFAVGAGEIFASHPPLEARIRALDPSFTPEEFAQVAKQLEAARESSPAAAKPARDGAAFVRRVATAAVLAGAEAARADVDPAHVSDRVANPRPMHVRHAERLRESLPAEVAAAAGDPARAPHVMLALLLGDGAAEREALAASLGATVADAVAVQRAALATLPPEQRLPLLLQLVPTVGRLGAEERTRLLATADSMVRADGDVTVAEWAFSRLARLHLGEQLAPPRGPGGAPLLQREADLVLVLAVLARAGHASEATARDAFERGFTRALPGRRAAYAPPADWVAPLDAALDRLDDVAPDGKARIVQALAMVVGHDGELDLAEAELLRAICGALHCPLPPFVADEHPGNPA